MKKKIWRILILLFTLAYTCETRAQIVNFKISGYKIIIIPSDNFMIKTSCPQLGVQEIKGNTFSLFLKNPIGKVPKDTIEIYTNKIRNLSVNFAEISMENPLSLDSLYISATSSSGIINVHAEYLKISAKAGSNIIIKGRSSHLERDVSGYSIVQVDSSKRSISNLSLPKALKTIPCKEISTTFQSLWQHQMIIQTG